MDVSHREQEDVKDVVREVEVLNLVSDHPNVAELVATFEDTHYVHLVRATGPVCPKPHAQRLLCLQRRIRRRNHTLRCCPQVLELCQGGELFDRIVEQGTFTERTAAGECAASIVLCAS